MGDRWRQIVTHNGGSKFLALLLASLLWYLAAGQERMEVGYIIPVELENVPDTVAIEGSSLEFVHVRLRGPRTIIQNLSSQQVQASINLKDLKPGDNFIRIDAENISLPRSVEVVNISPPYLFTKAAARRLVPIKVHVRGKPAEGFTLAKVEAVPSNIYVIGQEAKVSIVRNVDTFPVNVRGMRESFSIKADLIPPDPEVRLMELKPTEVHVRIEEERPSRTIRNLPVGNNGSRNLLLKPSQVQVTVRGPAAALRALTAEGVRAEIDASGIQGEPVMRRVRILVPEGLEVVEVSPPVVQVTGEKER